jgi:DNA-binding transcriptional regulator YdaS (Cro superfamily)
MEATPICDPNQLDAFHRAVDAAGGQEKFAEMVGRTQSTVSRRLRAGLPLWAEVVRTVEAATGVSRHDLRPDLYPREESLAQPPAASAPCAAGGSDSALEGVRS